MYWISLHFRKSSIHSLNSHKAWSCLTFFKAMSIMKDRQHPFLFQMVTFSFISHLTNFNCHLFVQSLTVPIIASVELYTYFWQFSLETFCIHKFWSCQEWVFIVYWNRKREQFRKFLNKTFHSRGGLYVKFFQQRGWVTNLENYNSKRSDVSQKTKCST